MNTLRTPLIALVVVIVALIAWFVWAHEQSVAPAAVPQTQSATTTPTTTAAVAQSTAAATTPTPTLDPTVVAQTIVGSWQSTDDSSYSVSITADGKWTDYYEGANATSSISQTGSYELFTSQDPDKTFTGVLVPGVVYLKVAEGTDVNYFSVLEASGTNLQLKYLDQSTTLSFVKEE